MSCRRMVYRILGTLILASPLVLMLAFIVSKEGWGNMFSLLLVIAVIWGWVFLGAWLMCKSGELEDAP